MPRDNFTEQSRSKTLGTLAQQAGQDAAWKIQTVRVLEEMDREIRILKAEIAKLKSAAAPAPPAAQRSGP